MRTFCVFITQKRLIKFGILVLIANKLFSEMLSFPGYNYIDKFDHILKYKTWLIVFTL